MITENSNKLTGHFEIDETYENNSWIRTNIRTFAFGENNNNSDIKDSSFSDFSKARKTIGAIPIVARYNMEEDDLEGHNVILRKNKDDEYEMFHDTDALGFTSPNATFYFEEVNEGTELSPNYKTYVVIEDVYLWKRFDATKKILEWRDEGISTSVSMEIENVEGSFNKEGSFAISDFEFSAITALGSEVAPCFPMAEIQLYSRDEFKSDLKQLMFELSNTDNITSQNTSKETGGQIVTKDKQSKQETEDLNFELTHQQLSAKLRQNLETHRFVDKEGESARRYWYQDHTNTKVIYEDLAEAGQLYESPYTVNGNDVTVDLNDKVQASLAFIPDNRRKRDDDYSLTEELEKAQTKLAEFEATLTAKDTEVEETIESLKAKHTEEFEALKAEYAQTVEALKGDLATLAEKSVEFESISTEVEELRTFKRTTELAQVKEKFSSKLDEKSLDAILEASADKTLDVLESEIFAEIGKQNFSLIQDEKETKQLSINFSQKQQETYNGVYSALIAKHINK